MDLAQQKGLAQNTGPTQNARAGTWKRILLPDPVSASSPFLRRSASPNLCQRHQAPAGVSTAAAASLPPSPPPIGSTYHHQKSPASFPNFHCSTTSNHHRPDLKPTTAAVPRSQYHHRRLSFRHRSPLPSPSPNSATTSFQGHHHCQGRPGALQPFHPILPSPQLRPTPSAPLPPHPLSNHRHQRPYRTTTVALPFRSTSASRGQRRPAHRRHIASPSSVAQAIDTTVAVPRHRCRVRGMLGRWDEEGGEKETKRCVLEGTRAKGHKQEDKKN